MQPPTLFHVPRVVDTSQAAAASIAERMPDIRSRVWRAIRDTDGLADVQLAATLKLKLDTARARRCELRDAGYVENSGRRVLVDGQPRIVWAVSGLPFDEESCTRRVAQLRRARADDSPADADDDDTDADLAAIVAAWPRLSVRERGIVRALINAIMEAPQ